MSADHCNCKGICELSRNIFTLLMNLRPVRTYNTACVYFHKFRLVHSDREFAIHVRLWIYLNFIILILSI